MTIPTTVAVIAQVKRADTNTEAGLGAVNWSDRGAETVAVLAAHCPLDCSIDPVDTEFEQAIKDIE
jgi:hypothetical protein